MALISRSNNTADEKEPNQIAKQKQRVIEAILLFFVYGKPNFEGALIGALFSFCFFFCDLRFDSLDHLGELGFALLLCFGVDVEFLSFAAGQSWEEASLPEVVVYLIQTSGAGFAYLSRDGFGMGLCGRTRGVYVRFHRSII